jgi:hypothetical protein
MAMLVRLKSVKKITPKQYRLTFDLMDHEREHWDYGDCQLRVDLWDEPSHRAQMRGPLLPAWELYQLSRDEPPTGSEAKLLWEIGEAVDGFVDRIFSAGIICPFGPPAKADTPERSE